MSSLLNQSAQVEYRPRSPESTVLFQAVAGNYRTFEAVCANEEKVLPKHVGEEFESFLRCGILAHGFLRLKCGDCKTEKLVPFSCKKRGFCSSCGGRRMSESAAHLIDQVFPKVGVRQWVLSFPMQIRFILAKNSKIQTRILGIVHLAITRFIQNKAKQKGFRSKLTPGAVTLIQRFGGALNLNVHFHMLFLEGGFYESDSKFKQGPRFFWVNPPTDAEIKDLLALIAFRSVRFLKKKGYFNDALEQDVPEEEVAEASLLPEIQAASVQSKVGVGARKGQSIRRLGSMEIQDFHPELKGSLCAQANGFSLHAAVYCEKWERTKLEQLCRYITRPAVAEERLSLRPNGDIVLRLKRKYSDGTSHLLFSGLEFVEKLSALVPPPRVHLARYFGCLAPHSKIRSQIVPKPIDEPVGECVEAANGEGREDVSAAKQSKRIAWAELLARVFQIDVLKCDCGGEYKIIAAILETGAIRKILRHLKIPDIPPPVALSRVAQQMTFA